jgi:hypothetical protein
MSDPIPAYVPSIGTISHGTLRNADLMPAFANELRMFDPTSSLVHEADAVAALHMYGWHQLYETEEATDLVVALIDALQSRAPEGKTFGAHPSDGACFGWWMVEEAE